MTEQYDFKKIEDTWKDKWVESKVYEAIDFSSKPKKYILAELPYPSGAALHTGHIMRYTVPDIYSRFLRMRGYNVLFPMGWDAFGLPAENYAVKTGVHPSITTQDAIKTMKDSLIRMGYGIDWTREIDTTDPKYYKWTQWLFLKFWENGLAELREMPIWWCERLKTVLADEEILTDKEGNKISERGEYGVEKRTLKQWVLKIPQYAEKLIDGLKDIDFPESIKSAQINWIGKKEGINISYDVESTSKKISVFTTRPDTNFGATFVVLAPEHPLALEITTPENSKKVKDYINLVKNKSDMERANSNQKTGVFTGSYAINNLNGYRMPVYISDFVLINFGTGALVGVPGHDRRDFEFAKTFGLPVKRVVVGSDKDESPIEKIEQVQENEGKMINSEFLDEMDIHEATTKIMDYMEEKGYGKKVIIYGIRDWVFSRQRYWGEPIPLIYVEPDNHVEEVTELPVILPSVPDYEPTSDAASPLIKNKEWVNTKNKDGKPAKRETNTMPNWAGSCWYYMRYIDPNNDKEFTSMKKLKYWLPVDRYFGGSEHTTMHLLYSRFWHRFFYDLGLVPTPEPYAWRLNGGLLLGPDGRKMSKSIGNVINPMDIVDNYGADALRICVAFLGPYEDTYPWNENGIKACWRLVKNIYELKAKVISEGHVVDPALNRKFHKMVKNITEMFDNLKMNTAVSEIMIFVNEVKKVEKINLEIWKGFLKAIAPIAPFVAEELWQEVNGYKKWQKENSVHLQEWPTFDASLVKETKAIIAIQINGRVKDQIEVDVTDSEEKVKEGTLALPKIMKELEGKIVKRFLYVPGRIVSIVC